MRADRLLELFRAKQVDDAQALPREHGLAAFVTCQDEYSLLVRDIERDLLPLMQQHGMSLLPYSPLASGFLTGKYRAASRCRRTRGSPTAATTPPTSSTSGTGR